MQQASDDGNGGQGKQMRKERLARENHMREGIEAMLRREEREQGKKKTERP